MKGIKLLGFGVLIFGFIAGSVFGGTEGTTVTFYGIGAGGYNSGAGNVFIGNYAGYGNSTGYDNTFLGYYTGYNNITGHFNTFIGDRAGYFNTTGNYNTFVGDNAGSFNTTGHYNTFLGTLAGQANTRGCYNAFLGYHSGNNNINGSQNAFLGNHAGAANTSGHYNTFLGSMAGSSNTEGPDNAFLGYQSGYNNTIGSKNTFLGKETGFSNIDGNSNVFLGYQAGYYETGSDKLYIANSHTRTPLIYGEFDNKILTINGKLKIGGGTLTITNSFENNVSKFASLDVSHYSNAEFPFTMVHAISHPDSNLLHIGGGTGGGNAATQIDFFTAENNTTRVGTTRMTIRGNGNVGFGRPGATYPLHMASGAYVTTGGVWTNASSRKYKDQIKGLEAREAVDALLALNPVTFVYKTDRSEKHVGFIAEDVPELLATKDRKGLSPMDIVAVLTKTLQEQQKFVLEQQKLNQELLGKISELENTIKQMTAPVVPK